MTPRAAGPGPWREFRRIIQGSGFIFACRIAGAGLTLLVQILLARWMGAAELGIYVLAFSWCVLLGTLSTLGFSPAAMRFVNLALARGEPGYIKAFVGYGLRSIGIASILLAGTGALLTWVLLDHSAANRLPLFIALGVVPFFAVLHFICAVANGYARFALGFLPTSVLRPLVFCGLVTLWWSFGPGLRAPIAMGLQASAILIVLTLTAIYFRGFIRGQGDRQISPAEPRTWIRTGLSLLIAAIFTGYFPEIVIILSGTLLPSDELAVLHVSFRIAMLVSFGLFAIDAFTAPEVARLYAAGDRTSLQTVVNHTTRLRFVASLIAVSAFVVLGRRVLGLFGDTFVAGYPLLLILSAGQLVQGSVGPVVRLMSVSGHQDRCLVVFAVALATLIALIALLAPRYGATGVAVAASLDVMLWTFWMRRLTIRHLELRLRIW